MSNELTPLEQGPLSLTTQDPLPDWLGLHGSASLSTFDTKSESGLRMLTKMSIGCDHELSNMINEEIDLVSWYMAPYERMNAVSGELQHLVFIGLVDAGGTTYSTSSIGVRRSLLTLAREFGFKPWIPPVKCKIRSVKLSLGNMFALEFISRNVPVPPAKESKK